MSETTLNNIVDTFHGLNFNDKIYLLDIFQKQVTEEKRNKLIKRVNEAERNFAKGKVKKGSVDDLLKDLYDYSCVRT
jgi:hypothetical protein